MRHHSARTPSGGPPSTPKEAIHGQPHAGASTGTTSRGNDATSGASGGANTAGNDTGVMITPTTGDGSATNSTGPSDAPSDPVAEEAIETAVTLGARVVAVTRTDEQAAHLKRIGGLAGTVSLETLDALPARRRREPHPISDLGH